jgi:hypothetical protein
MLQSKSYGLQNETRQYLRRLYAYGKELNTTDVADIDNFIKGLKQFNLWQNIVCWAMRSQYNIGSGSVLLSLGGFGRYDGSMFNSPAWSNTGIIFNGTSHYIQFNNPIRSTNINNIGLFSSIDSDAITLGARTIIGSFGGSGTRGPLFTVAGSSVQGGVSGGIYFDSSYDGVNTFFPVPGGSNSTGNTSVPEIVSAGYLDGRRYIEYNNAARSSDSSIATPGVWNNNSLWRIGARLDGAYFLGSISFSLFSNKGLTANQYTLLNLLYKSTIGKGLGLP